MQVLRAARAADFLAPKCSLNFAGSDKIKSTQGGFMTLLYMGVVAAFTLYSFVDYFTNTRYELVIVSNKSLDSPEVINLVEHRRLPFIKVKYEDDTFVKSSEVPRWMSLVLSYTNWTVLDGEKVKIETNFTYSDCNSAVPNWREIYHDLDMDEKEMNEFIMCLNHKDLAGYAIHGKEGLSKNKSEPSFSAVLNIYPCNSTISSDPDFCHTSAYDLSWYRVNFGFVEAKVDLSNMERPVTYYVNWDREYYSDPSVFNYYIYEIVLNHIEDEKGFPYSNVNRTTYSTLKPVLSSIGLLQEQDRRGACAGDRGSCWNMVQLDFYGGNERVEYLRIYKSIDAVLGNIGGVIEIIFICFSLVHGILTSTIYKKIMVETVFGIVPATTKFFCLTKQKGKVGQKNSRGSYFAPKEVIAKAYDTIMSSLDVCMLSHQMFILRFLSSAILKDYQLDLMPLIALNCFNKEEPEKLKEKEAPLTAITGDKNLIQKKPSTFQFIANFIRDDFLKQKSDSMDKASILNAQSQQKIEKIEKSPFLPIRDTNNMHLAEAAYEKLVGAIEQRNPSSSPLLPSPENFDSRLESESADVGRQPLTKSTKVDPILDNLAHSFDRRCHELCQGELAKLFGLYYVTESS